MLVSDFDYELPEELIAQLPADKRENSKMMVLERSSHKIQHKHFYDIVDLIDENSILVLNNTKVMPARLYGMKEETGAKIEVFLLKQLEGKTWETLIKPSKRVKEGTIIKISDELSAKAIEKTEEDGGWIVEMIYEGNILEVLHRNGNIPLPPYIERKKSLILNATRQFTQKMKVLLRLRLRDYILQKRFCRSFRIKELR